jgi:hypothetical protein
VRGQREIEADEPGYLAAVRWARGLDEERVWAIEDCRHVSRRLEQAPLAAGERVVRVAPHRMGASRKRERERGKSDQIDALAIARAVVKDGIEKLVTMRLNLASVFGRGIEPGGAARFSATVQFGRASHATVKCDALTARSSHALARR